MDRKTNESSPRAAPIALGDEELTAVTGAKGQGHAFGHDKSHGGGPPWLSLAPVVQQTNITNIYQTATDNSGSVTLVAGVVQGNSADL